MAKSIGKRLACLGGPPAMAPDADGSHSHKNRSSEKSTVRRKTVDKPFVGFFDRSSDFA
jgi:hypothetical protein